MFSPSRVHDMLQNTRLGDCRQFANIMPRQLYEWTRRVGTQSPAHHAACVVVPRRQPQLALERQAC
eukprot:12942589-Alexandrium_andersonii.AAC.1